MKFLIENTDRKFTHVDGFSDNTDYIVIDTLKEIVVSFSKEGNMMSVLNGLYSLDDCVEYVRLGLWKEIK